MNESDILQLHCNVTVLFAIDPSVVGFQANIKGAWSKHHDILQHEHNLKMLHYKIKCASVSLAFNSVIPIPNKFLKSKQLD